MTGFRISAAALMVAGLSSCTYMTKDFERITDQSERRFGPGIGKIFKEVPLRELMANASSYKYMDVKFKALFNRRNEGIFVPFLTTLNAEHQVGFSVWPSDAKLWEEADRMTYLPTLYIDKGHPDIETITGASRYALFEIRAVVASDFDDKLFIYVHWVNQLEEAVYTDDGLANLHGGLNALTQKRPAVAIDKLEKSLAGVWTRAARLQIHLDLAGLYADRGDWEAAVLHYEGALANDAANATAKAGIEKARAELARKKAMEAGKTQP